MVHTSHGAKGWPHLTTRAAWGSAGTQACHALKAFTSRDAGVCGAAAWQGAPLTICTAFLQVGQRDPAMRQMRTLLRRYPDFNDMRAALAAALWAAGKEGEAETTWARVDDPRWGIRGLGIRKITTTVCMLVGCSLGLEVPELYC